MNYPYDDGKMNYDMEAHRYVLTPKGVLDDLGINLDIELDPEGDAVPQTMAKRFLNQVSITVYNWIYMHNARFKMYIEYLLAKYPPCREILCEAMKQQVLYALNNNFFQKFSGVNVVTGSVIDKAAMRDRTLDPDAEIILSQTLPNGVCLLYSGFYNVPLNLEYRRDY